MSYRIRTMRRAQEDFISILEWIANVRHAPDGAAALIDAYDKAVESVSTWPESFGLAPEDDFDDRVIRQFPFKTSHGRPYRGLFTIRDEEVVILRVRGPGQADLEPGDL